jgi:hypothetical protein
MERGIQMVVKRRAIKGKYCCIYVFLFIFGGFLLPAAHAATYYIDSQNGNDSRTTTQAQNASTPWLTIQKCANNAVAGDTCSVATGTYAERVSITTNGGTGNPATGVCDTYTTFQSTPTRTATTYGFRINANCIEVKDFNVISGGANVTCDNVGVQCLSGISIGKSYTKVTNNYISNWRSHPGIGMDPSGVENLVWADRGSWVTISNNTIYNSQNGITVWGDNVTVSGNEVNRLRNYVTSEDSDYSRAWGIGVTFTNNYFHGTTLSEKGGAHVDCLQTWDYHLGWLQNLLFDHNMCIDADQTMIEGHSNFGMSYLTFTNNVYSCAVASGMACGGFDVEDTPYVTVNNNTFYNIGPSGSYVAPIYFADNNNMYSQNETAQNNIISSAANVGIMWFSASITERYNLIYGNAGSPIGCDTHSCAATDKVGYTAPFDPLFVNPSNIVGPDGLPFTADDGLRLQAGSPAIGAGYGGVDMGAYKYDSGPVVPPQNIRIIK